MYDPKPIIELIKLTENFKERKMNTLEFRIEPDELHEYRITHWVDDPSKATVIEFINIADSIKEIDNFILPLKSKYDQVIQILPNGKRKVI